MELNIIFAAMALFFAWLAIRALKHIVDLRKLETVYGNSDQLDAKISNLATSCAFFVSTSVVCALIILVKVFTS